MEVRQVVALVALQGLGENHQGAVQSPLLHQQTLLEGIHAYVVRYCTCVEAHIDQRLSVTLWCLLLSQSF